MVSKRSMSATFIDGLPDVSDDAYLLRVRVRGLSAFVYAPRFLARFSLTSGKVKWVVEREPIMYPKSTRDLPRRIEVFGRNVVCNAVGDAVAEILPTEDGAVVVESRHVQTGELLWEHRIPIPRAAAWAEKKPAWPGGPTEEIHAFLADDSKHLVVCHFRETRRSMLSWPSKGIEVFSLPPYRCQTDAIRFDPMTGAVLWRGSFPKLRVGILERERFAGFWSGSRHLGILDLESGANKILLKATAELGWPVRRRSALCVPWHA
jgi:hypothetical protein